MAATHVLVELVESRAFEHAHIGHAAVFSDGESYEHLALFHPDGELAGELPQRIHLLPHAGEVPVVGALVGGERQGARLGQAGAPAGTGAVPRASGRVAEGAIAAAAARRRARRRRPRQLELLRLLLVGDERLVDAIGDVAPTTWRASVAAGFSCTSGRARAGRRVHDLTAPAARSASGVRAWPSPARDDSHGDGAGCGVARTCSRLSRARAVRMRCSGVAARARRTAARAGSPRRRAAGHAAVGAPAPWPLERAAAPAGDVGVHRRRRRARLRHVDDARRPARAARSPSAGRAVRVVSARRVSSPAAASLVTGAAHATRATAIGRAPRSNARRGEQRTHARRATRRLHEPTRLDDTRASDFPLRQCALPVEPTTTSTRGSLLHCLRHGVNRCHSDGRAFVPARSRHLQALLRAGLLDRRCSNAPHVASSTTRASTRATSSLTPERDPRSAPLAREERRLRELRATARRARRPRARSIARTSTPSADRHDRHDVVHRRHDPVGRRLSRRVRCACAATCVRLPITELGCAAGAAALSRAREHVRAYPEHTRAGACRSSCRR